MTTRKFLPHMQRPQQRYFIALYETSMRLNEPRKLTWDKIDFKRGLIRLAADDVKEKYPRRTPISWELRKVLEELKEEQKKITNLGNLVFTRPNGRAIKSIRKALELALQKAEIDNKAKESLRTRCGVPGSRAGRRRAYL